MDWLQGSFLVVLLGGVSDVAAVVPTVSQAALGKANALTGALVASPLAPDGDGSEKLGLLRDQAHLLINLPVARPFRPRATDGRFLSDHLDNGAPLEALRQLVTATTVPGINSIDIADVADCLRGYDGTYLGTGSAQGRYRAQPAGRAAIESPPEGEHSLRQAAGVFMSIGGGWDLSIKECNTIADSVAAHLSSGAVFAFATPVDARWSDRIEVHLLVGVKTTQRLAPIQPDLGCT